MASKKKAQKKTTKKRTRKKSGKKKSAKKKSAQRKGAKKTKKKKTTKKTKKKKSSKATRIEKLLAETGDDMENPKQLRRAARRLLSGAERGRGPTLDLPERLELQLLIADSYWKQGHLRRAQREYLRVTESFPREVRAMTRLGLIAELFGESRIAAQHYEQALVIAEKGTRRAARLAYARFLRRKGDYKEALKLLHVTARSEKARSAAAAEAAYVECLMKGYDPDPLHGWQTSLKKLAADDPVFSYFLANYELWDGQPMEGVRRLRSFIARMETAAPSLANELYYETEHARRILARIEQAQSVPRP